MELNTEKIDFELERIGKNKSWLAKQLGVSRQNIRYYYVKKPISVASRIARVFAIDPKLLLK